METSIRRCLARDSRTVAWFWRIYINPNNDIGYSGLLDQISGRRRLKDSIRILIDDYISDFYIRKDKGLLNWAEINLNKNTTTHT